MTSQSSPSTSAGLLLSPENQIVCAKLSGLANPEVNQRAAALLLLDQGTTQAEAAEKSGLSIGQIRYLVKRFKEKGMEMFTAEVLAQATGTEAGNDSVDEPAKKVAAEAATEAPEAEPVTPEPPARDLPEEQGPETVEKAPGNKTAKVRKKASKKRPKRPKPVKKKKSKRKRKKKKQG